MLKCVHLFIEGSSRRAGGLLAELGEHEGLGKLAAAVDVGVDPAARESQRSLLAVGVGQPGVGPQVDAAEVDVLRRVIPREIAAQRQRVIRIVLQELCTAHTQPLALQNIKQSHNIFFIAKYTASIVVGPFL